MRRVVRSLTGAMLRAGVSSKKSMANRAGESRTLHSFSRTPDSRITCSLAFEAATPA